MTAKRVSSGRLVRVESRRRSRKWRIVVGVTATLVVAVIIIFAYRYKHRKKEPETPSPPATAETAATVETAATAEAITPATAQVVTLVVNGTSVPQRYGNALAALEEFNVECGNAYRYEQYRPKIAYAEKSSVFYREGYQEWAQGLAEALAADVPVERVDLVVICGQDVSKLIIEALAKNVPAAESTNVEVLNGCGIEGAAGKITERLEANGYNVVAVGNAASFDFKETVIETAEEKNDAGLRAANLFGIGERKVEPLSYDVKIIIGDDYTMAAETP
jgi:hypothetical protein